MYQSLNDLPKFCPLNRRRLQKQNKQGISTSFICFEKRTKHKRILSSKSVSQKEYSHKQSRIVSNSLLALLHMTNLYYSLWDSARPKPGFGIGNRNQDQVSVSVSGPELFLPKPKLFPIWKIYQKIISVITWKIKKSI